MPSVSATAYPAEGHVLVLADWTDVPAATCVQVRRVVVATGESAPLRTYVWPCSDSGEYQHLSGGVAAFWDTEAPLDTPIYYEAVAVDAAGDPIPAADPVFFDDFTRVVAAGWGNGWTITGGGPAGDYLVNGTQGVFAISGTYGTERRVAQAATHTNVEVLGRYQSTVLPTGADVYYAVSARRDATSAYTFRLNVTTANTVTVSIAQTVASVTTVIGAPVAVSGATATSAVLMRARVSGHTVQVRAWLEGTTEPTAWTTTLTSTSVLTPGLVDVGLVTAVGTTNVPPISFLVDDIIITGLDPTSGDSMSVISGNVTLDSDGDFYLRDPVRPCNDRRVKLCFDPDVECVAGEDIFFAELSAESYPPNSALFQPTNAKYPIQSSRQRRDADAALTLVTRTFVDRDAVLALNAPGSPLQWVAPPAYGIPDRYMAVAPVTVSRGLPDHRFQPRLINMPYTTVARPIGPTQGLCGRRFADLCDTYATWDDAAAAGATWISLVIGTPAELGWRTWQGVLTDFTLWSGVLANGTWQDARDL